MDHSEIKHFPKVDHTPAELDEPAKRLLKAAALIETHGHAKLTTCDDRGRMCFRGALVCAQGLEHGKSYRFSAGLMDRISEDADQRVAFAVGGDAVAWNNEPHRTAEEVISTMRAVALGL